MRANTTRALPSNNNIEVDPLLVALFDLPCGLRILPNNKATVNNVNHSSSLSSGSRQLLGRRPSLPRNKHSTSSSASGRPNDFTSPRFKTSPGQEDDGVETDNTSLLHGENISLTDEEFSDAAAYFNDEMSVTSRFSATTQGQPFAAMRSTKPMMKVMLGGGFDQYSHASSIKADNPNDSQNGASAKLKIDTSIDSLEDVLSSKTPPKKKKKKKSPSAFKSLKKIMGRKSSSKSKMSGASVHTMSSSMDEDDSVISSPAGDMKGDLNSFLAQNGEDGNNISFDRLSALQSKIANIRATIHSLESDLIATRNELVVANQHLQAAHMELGGIQRAALEAEVGLSKLAQQRGMSTAAASALMLSPLPCSEVDGSELETSMKDSRSRGSMSSFSSDRLHFLTPTSSLVESGEDSDISACYTPRSTASSHGSILSLADNDITPPFATVMDKDKTPVTKNVRRRKLDSALGSNVTSVLTYGIDPNKIMSPMGTPSTAASSQEEINSNGRAELLMPEIEGNENHVDESDGEHRGRRVTFSRQQSFIRTHDLIVNGCDTSPLLPLHGNKLSDVINALFDRGLEFAMDESDRWVPIRDTGKILAKRATQMKNGTFDSQGPMGPWRNAASGQDVFVWHSQCPHDGHGSEYPMVKARGLIPTSALSIAQLLLDSDRVKQYNKMSLGRTDEHCFAMGVEKVCPRTGIQGEAKIVRSKSQPPIVRKPIELRILLHARRLSTDEEEMGGGARYLTIARSVWETAEGTTDAEDSSSTRCEMLLGVNLVREVDVPQANNGEKWCELTTITHAVSPGIPLAIGKRIGLAAAGKYISDIRNVFEKGEF